MKFKILVATLSLFLLVGFANAQTSLGFNGIGGQLSLNDPEGNFGFGFGLGANANLGELTPGLFLVPDVNYWWSSKTVEPYDLKLSDFQINATVHYYLNKTFQGFYAGGGLGLNFLTSKGDYKGTVVYPGFIYNSYSTSDTKIGINLDAGWTQPVTPTIDGFAMFRYSLISNVNTVTIMVGATMNLTK